MTGKTSTFAHPSAFVYRLQQYAGMVLLVIMLMAIAGQFWLAISQGAWIFGVMALMMGLLVVPVLALISATPRITLDEQGILLEPLVWPRRFVPWQDVLRMEDYPLLPEADQEVIRRAMIGRKRYRPAEGKMLVVRSLPPQYRAAGILAGLKGAPIIVVTNRSHSDYDTLIRRLNAKISA